MAALNFVKSLPNVDPKKVMMVEIQPLLFSFQISSIGFCFGGLCSIDLARINSGICGAVSFHGVFNPIDGETDFDKMDPIEAKLLIAHGDTDDHVNPQVDAFIEELRARKADFQFIRYANAPHGFTMICESTFFEGS